MGLLMIDRHRACYDVLRLTKLRRLSHASYWRRARGLVILVGSLLGQERVGVNERYL
jgi:hypothetical protein